MCSSGNDIRPVTRARRNVGRVDPLEDLIALIAAELGSRQAQAALLTLATDVPQPGMQTTETTEELTTRLWEVLAEKKPDAFRGST